MIAWNLKKWLATEHDIYRPSELQAILRDRVGIEISLQALSTLLNNKPSALRLQTIQAICDAFNCRLSDFCDVIPDAVPAQKRERKVAGDRPKRLYGGKTTPAKPESIFPDPASFEELEQ